MSWSKVEKEKTTPSLSKLQRGDDRSIISNYITVFYDHTEVLLSDEAKVVTYVDKKRHRTTYRLDDVTIDPSQEIGKRLKYTRDIFSQLLPSK